MEVKITRFVRSTKEYSGGVSRVGFADVEFAGVVRIRGCVIKRFGDGRLRTDMPSQRGADGKWYPICFPVSREAREALEAAVSAAVEVAEASATS